MGKIRKMEGPIVKSKFVLIISLLVAVFSITACDLNKTSDVTDQTTEQQPVIGDEASSEQTTENTTIGYLENYQTVLQKATSSEDLYLFYEQNIESGQPEEIDQVVNDIIGYEEDINKVDFARIAAKSTYLSEEMQGYIGFMETEQKTPSYNAEGFHTTLGDLLEKCYQLEMHMKSYKDGITFNRAYEKYSEYMTAAISGGYDENNQVENKFLADDKSHISDDAINQYAAFVEKHPDSQTAIIVSEYLKLVMDTNKEFHSGLVDYYHNLETVYSANILDFISNGSVSGNGISQNEAKAQ
jgi:hypothetical protein